MLTDPVLAWIIALAVCTLFGFVMYRKGFVAGGNNSSAIIVAALEADGISRNRILQSLKNYYAQQMGSGNGEG